MALRLREVEPDTPTEYIITPTGDELPEMEAHWERLESILGQELVWVPGPSFTRIEFEYMEEDDA